MILGLLGDLHLTNRGPEKRLDDYWKTLIRKVTQALHIFDEKNCDCILQVGDFFDSPIVGNRVISSVIELLNCFGRVDERRVFCVWGQHDISGHSKSTLPNSPLEVLRAAGVAKIISDKYELGSTKNGRPICIYGASFGEEVPKTYKSRKDAYNILVTHRMIGDRPLWPGHELPGPRQFLRKHPSYSLVVSGDYHYRFTETYDGRTIVNPGALVRKTISKFDLEHKPAVVIFDTETNEAEVVELRVRSVEEIFDLTKTEEKKDSNILLDFIEGLRNQNKEKSIGWKHILLEVLKRKNSSPGVGKEIDLCLEEVKK